MKTLTIDRFEGNYAICEDSDAKLFAIEKTELPHGAAEGDVLNVDEAEGTLRVNEEETARRRSRVNKLQNELFKN